MPSNEDRDELLPKVDAIAEYSQENPKNSTTDNTGEGPPYLKDKVIDEEAKVSPVRWYILTLFAASAFIQNLVWNTWGPISASAEFALEWTDSTVALMNNWGPIAYIVSAFAFSWLMDTKGMRVAVLLTNASLFLGTALRCIPAPLHISKWLIHMGQLFNGLAGPVLGAGPPLISSLWFPVSQRVTATALASSVGFIGTALAFITGPLLVPEVHNATACKNTSSEYYNMSDCEEQKHSIQSRISLLMYIECGCATLIFILVLAYFPARPKNAPSVTAGRKRIEFMSGLKQLARNGKFWMLAVPYALSNGVFQCWSSVLDINLKPLGIHEDTAGWIGFWCTIAGQGAAMVIGVFADRFARRMKIFVISLYSLATVAVLLFTLACIKLIPFNLVTLYSTSIVSSVCLFGTTALFYELGCEASYPVAEGLTNGTLTWSLNFSGLLFLLVLMIPSIGTAWMNWCLLATTAVCIPVFFFYKERYARYNIDTVVEKDVMN